MAERVGLSESGFLISFYDGQPVIVPTGQGDATLRYGGGNEVVVDHGDVSGSVICDLTNGNMHRMNCTGDTTITIQNWFAPPAGGTMAIRIQGNGHTITWPTINWVGNAGNPPDLPPTGWRPIVIMRWDDGSLDGTAVT